MAKSLIKLIKIIILIPAGLGWLALAACDGEGSSSSGKQPDLRPDTSLSGEPTEADPLKPLEEQGKLPKIGTGGKGPILGAPSGAGAEGLSLYPPSVDPDQDNVLATDNCPNVFNPGQEDANNNGVGDACE